MRARRLASAALLGSLALMLSLSHVRLPYPLLPYLKFDFAEIPAIVAALVFGFADSVAVMALHYLGLVLTTGDLLGPAFKFMAELSTVVGLLPFRRRGLRACLLASAASRVAVMSLVNFLFLQVFAPGFLEAIRLPFAGAGGRLWKLVVVLILTAVFNAAHVCLDLAVAWPAASRLRGTRRG